jgi:hypothetical protein
MQNELRTLIQTPNLEVSLVERAGNILEAIRIGKDFLSRTQVAQQLRGSIDK